MRTPVGSSNSIARSLRHNSPAWLPSGVTLTSADDWPFAMAPWEIQTATMSSAARPSDRTRMRTSLSGDATAAVRPKAGPSGPTDHPSALPDVETSQQLFGGIGLLRARMLPRDAEALGAGELAPFRRA